MSIQIDKEFNESELIVRFEDLERGETFVTVFEGNTLLMKTESRSGEPEAVDFTGKTYHIIPERGCIIVECSLKVINNRFWNIGKQL